MRFIPGQILECVQDISISARQMGIDLYPEIGQIYTVKAYVPNQAYKGAVILEELYVEKCNHIVVWDSCFFVKRPPIYEFTNEQILKLLL